MWNLLYINCYIHLSTFIIKRIRAAKFIDFVENFHHCLIMSQWVNLIMEKISNYNHTQIIFEYIIQTPPTFGVNLHGEVNWEEEFREKNLIKYLHNKL